MDQPSVFVVIPEGNLLFSHGYDTARGLVLTFPEGKTPVVLVNASRSKLSVISTVTNKGQMLWKVFSGAMNAKILNRVAFMTRTRSSTLLPSLNLELLQYLIPSVLRTS